MLILRAKHFAALREAALETFVDRVVEHVAGEFPAAYRDHGRFEVREIVERAVGCAEEAGIASEAGICRYVEAWFRHGVAFDRGDHALQCLLRDSALSEDERLAALEDVGRGLVL